MRPTISFPYDWSDRQIDIDQISYIYGKVIYLVEIGIPCYSVFGSGFYLKPKKNMTSSSRTSRFRVKERFLFDRNQNWHKIYPIFQIPFSVELPNPANIYFLEKITYVYTWFDWPHPHFVFFPPNQSTLSELVVIPLICYKIVFSALPWVSSFFNVFIAGKTAINFFIHVPEEIRRQPS